MTLEDYRLKVIKKYVKNVHIMTCVLYKGSRGDKWSRASNIQIR